MTENSSPILPRRLFNQASAAAAVCTIVPRHVLGGPKFVAPSDKVNIAVVGVGGQGRTNIRALFEEPDAQVVAVADPIAESNLDAFYYKGLGGREPVKADVEKHYAAQTPNFACAAYEDFRVMLEKEQAIDAILCATPDHLHAYVSVAAMRAGKHVYCEKPLTHNIWEARTVAQVAEATGVATHGEMCYFHFGQRGDKPPVQVIWYTGGLMPPCPVELGEKSSLPGRGVLFVGERGVMLVEGAGGPPRLLPYEKTREYQKPAESIPRVKGHHRDWLDACKGGTPASSNFEYGAKLTELVLLGVLSLRAQQRIYWDAPTMTARNAPQAETLIRGTYREGWKIE